jgi:hypothetical protein
VNQFYPIKEGDHFISLNYPAVDEELSAIKRGIDHLHSIVKGEIIVSYFKDHCLKREWIENYPELIKLITSSHFKATHLESIFESCRDNNMFLLDLEDHIRNIFSHGIERQADARRNETYLIKY